MPIYIFMFIYRWIYKNVGECYAASIIKARVKKSGPILPSSESWGRRAYVSFYRIHFPVFRLWFPRLWRLWNSPPSRRLKCSFTATQRRNSTGIYVMSKQENVIELDPCSCTYAHFSRFIDRIPLLHVPRFKWFTFIAESMPPSVHTENSEFLVIKYQFVDNDTVYSKIIASFPSPIEKTADPPERFVRLKHDQANGIKGRVVSAEVP